MSAGCKFDNDKPDWSLLPLDALTSVVRVLMIGAGRYGRSNWEGVAPYRIWSALLRHLVAFRQGETHDPDTGLPHLAHACCNLIFLLWHGDELDPFEIENGTVTTPQSTDARV